MDRVNGAMWRCNDEKGRERTGIDHKWVWYEHITNNTIIIEERIFREEIQW